MALHSSSEHEYVTDSEAMTRQRVAETTAGQLEERGIPLTGDESEEELALLAEAVEAFERAVARRGGDSYTNSPRSSEPDDTALVLPKQSRDESTTEYARRIRNTAERLETASE
jgi:hypothetical protein